MIEIHFHHIFRLPFPVENESPEEGTVRPKWKRPRRAVSAIPEPLFPGRVFYPSSVFCVCAREERGFVRLRRGQVSFFFDAGLEASLPSSSPRFLPAAFFGAAFSPSLAGGLLLRGEVLDDRHLGAVARRRNPVRMIRV